MQRCLVLRGCDAQGFTWLEEKWHVDLSGQSAEAVDTDGWSFAVDFPWLRMPPIPGSGRMCVLTHPIDYVYRWTLYHSIYP